MMNDLSKHWRAGAWAGASLVLAMVILQAITTSSALAAPASQTNPRESDCVVNVQHRAVPPVLLLGETVDMVFEADATCGVTTPLHVVFVLDASGSMAGTRSSEMKRAARSLIQRLNLEEHPETRVGVVQHNSTVRTLCQLTNETGRASSCVNKVGANGGRSIERGITEGLNVMRKGRSSAGGNIVNEFMIVVSGGASNTGCAPIREAADRTRSQGVALITVCLGPDCDRQCMQEIATSPQHAFSTNTPAELTPIFLEILSLVRDMELRHVDLVYQIEENMRLIPGSASPAAVVGPDQRTITFSRDFVTRSGFTATLQVLPLNVGFNSIGTGSRVEFRDQGNRTGQVEVTPAHVSVFQAFQPRRP